MKDGEAEVTSDELTSNISQSVLLHRWSVECEASSEWRLMPAEDTGEHWPGPGKF